MTSDDDDQLPLAARAARRLVSQSRAHAERTAGGIRDRTLNAPKSSPFGAERTLADNGAHRLAFTFRLEFMESMTNALVAHLQGLEVLVKGEVFYALPAIPVTRSVAEVAASFAWLFDPRCNDDERVARAYAGAFRSLEKSDMDVAFEGGVKGAPVREQLIQELTLQGVRVLRRGFPGSSLGPVAR